MFPREIIVRAERILSSQPYVPLSPAVSDERGDVYVCAAAALALAGIEIKHGAEAAKEFRGSICSMDNHTLENTYKRLGWQVSVCREMRESNDKAPASDRLRFVIQKLRNLDHIVVCPIEPSGNTETRTV